MKKTTKKIKYAVAASCLMLGPPVLAEIVTDGSLPDSTATTLTGTNVVIGQELGHTSGLNLYHSFSEFNVDAGQTVTFTGNVDTANVISRITGTSPSQIDGTIRSTMPSANFWFFNPYGMFFGKNASIDINGSFHVATADYVELGGGVKYYADYVAHSVFFSSQPPQAFGFITNEGEEAKAGSIRLDGTRLEVGDRQEISIIGRGDVQLNSSFIRAPGGITVVSVNSDGEVIYSDSGKDISSFKSFGDLAINGASFSVNGIGDGEIVLRGGDVEFYSHSTDYASNVSSIEESFWANEDLLEQPCELAGFHGRSRFRFEYKNSGDESAFGLKTQGVEGPIGMSSELDCL